MFDPDSLIPAATASFFAVKHRDIVEDNFSEIFQLLMTSLHDEAFLEQLRKLGPRGTVTRSIKLPTQDDEMCFADKLWFKVKKSSSTTRERYYISMGLTFKLSEYSCIPCKKIWMSYVAAGPIDFIQFLLGAPCAEAYLRDELAEAVYDTCFKAYNSTLSSGTEADSKKRSIPYSFASVEEMLRTNGPGNNDDSFEQFFKSAIEQYYCYNEDSFDDPNY